MIGRSSGARECRGHVAPARAAGGRGGPKPRAWAVILAAAALVLFLGGPLSALGEEGVPWEAVFQILTLTPEGRGVARGTAFFIDPSGLALTNSHVVYRAQHDPDKYVLFAIFNKEFYGVEIVCASHLDSDPAEAAEGPVGRDVAEIRLTPAARKYTWWLIAAPGAESPDGQPKFEVAPHTGSLQYFPFFTLGGGPEERGQVRVVGYGRISKATEKIVTTGIITKMATAKDGTPVFEIESSDRPERGSSGSPVLNEQDRVVGMYTWNEPKSDVGGLAISSAAFTTPCP